MKRRKLGHSGIEIGPLVFGSNVFGWTVNEAGAFQLLDAFVEAGLNCIDTADIYSTWVSGNKGGESETIIGRWLKNSGNRDKVIIATKVGMQMSAHQKGLSKSYIIQAIEDSLKRLQTDYIDLYQAHTDDMNTPLDETLEAFTDLIAAGKVRAIGASNYNAERLSKALQISDTKNYAHYQTLQPHYNLYEREYFEKTLEPICLEKQLGVITYFSLASGFLTGKYRSESDFHKSDRGGGMKKFFNERGFKILNALDDISKNLSLTPAQIALAWLMARPSVTAPIVSATSLKQLTDLIAATELKLDDALIKRLNSASAFD